MNWTKLLDRRRVRELRTNSDPSEDHRTPFEADYDRIVFSSPLRRLKDKTQVFPLDPNDFVRTRLTHSLEVSRVASGLTTRTLGLLKGTPQEAPSHVEQDLRSVAAAAGLVHDLGNPPFGHSGEDAISGWFSTPIGAKALDPISSTELRADLERFEGNARSFRHLSSLQLLADNHGLNLTAATLSASMKYIASSFQADKHHKSHGMRKPGFCQTEAPLVELVRTATGTGDARNPISYLVEAADDCVYSLCDIEDAIHKKVLTWSQLKSELKCLDRDAEAFAVGCEESITTKAKTAHLDLHYSFDEACAVQFRVLAQGKIIEHASNTFLSNASAILGGSFDGDLLGADAHNLGSCLVRSCKSLGPQVVYSTRPTLELELRGRGIIEDLLSLLWLGIQEFNGERPSPKSFAGKTYSLISGNYRTLFEYDWNNQPNSSNFDPEEWRHYLKLMLLTDYVAGMTDGYAANLHKRLCNG